MSPCIPDVPGISGCSPRKPVGKPVLLCSIDPFMLSMPSSSLSDACPSSLLFESSLCASSWLLLLLLVSFYIGTNEKMKLAVLRPSALHHVTCCIEEGTINVGPPSSAWPNNDSRSSRLRSRLRLCSSRRSNRSRSRSRDNDRRWFIVGGDSGLSGLMPCWARYRSALLIRFWGGGVFNE